MIFKQTSLGLLLAGCLLLIGAGSSLYPSLADSDRPLATAQPADMDAFTFVRIQYDSTGGFGESWYRHEGRDWQRWETDYPRAENNLLLRLSELTSLRVNPRPSCYG